MNASSGKTTSVAPRAAASSSNANIRPSALFAISLVMTMIGGMLSALIARTIYVAPVGAAVARKPQQAQPLIAAADAAMYDAKRAGRNRVSFHE